MESLCDLGLSSYEDRAYRALLALGSGTAREVSEESEVPMGRIYDALNGLTSRGLVREQTAGEPKRYAPVEPGTAVDRLIDARREELRAEIESYEASRDALVERLGSLDGDSRRFWTATVGPEESAALLWERLETADDRIVVVAAHVPPQLDHGDVGARTLDRLLRALDRGVGVTVLLAPSVFEAMTAVLDAERTTLALEEAGLELRLSEELDGNFHLIDDREVCMDLPDPLEPDRLAATVNLRDRSFARRVADGFSEVWARAEPIETV